MVKTKINFLNNQTGGLIKLDEPTNNLDDYSVEVVSKYIIEKSKDSTLLIIAHDERVINLCDNVYRIESGSVNLSS